MTVLSVKQIKEEAIKILESAKDGIRYSQITAKIKEDFPETNSNTINGAMVVFLKDNAEIAKPNRGSYILKKYYTESANNLGIEGGDGQHINITESTDNAPGGPKKLKEADFYRSFSYWVVNELEEANEAVELGGKVFGGKWNTPDVFGVLKPTASDRVKFVPQFVSAEIKTDVNQSVVAFGQAVSYRLFSHRSYVVVPKTVSAEDMDRLRALALISKIGVVSFDLDKDKPDYTLLERSAQSVPDMFYLNKIAKIIEERDKKLFETLFG